MAVPGTTHPDHKLPVKYNQEKFICILQEKIYIYTCTYKYDVTLLLCYIQFHIHFNNKFI